jgi:hypothetical protein
VLVEVVARENAPVPTTGHHPVNPLTHRQHDPAVSAGLLAQREHLHPQADHPQAALPVAQQHRPVAPQHPRPGRVHPA